MDTTNTARLHLELDLEFTDRAAVQAHALAWARENAGDNAQTLAGMASQAAEGAESALTMLVEPSEVVSGIPGVQAVGATMWVQGDGGDDDEDGNEYSDVGLAADDDLFDEDWAEEDDDSDDGENEEEWQQRIFNDGAKLPGLSLELLGVDRQEANPELRARQLHEATLLRGAIHWAYIAVVDELLEDVALLRESPESEAETQQIANLPQLEASSYGPLFAQQFLAVTFDLGAAMASSFRKTSCVAQELAMMLLLDQVEALTSMLPNLGLAQDWRGHVEGTLLASPNPGLLYEPGTAEDTPAAWFEPFTGSSVNPYAAGED